MKNFLFLLLLLLSVNSFAQQKSEQPSYISLVELLANPDKFNNKKVSLVGVFAYNENESVIYLSKDDKFYENTKNGFILKFSSENFRDLSKLSIYDGDYVTIIGCFNKNNKGSLQYFFSGAIEQITAFESKDAAIIEEKHMKIREQREER